MRIAVLFNPIAGAGRAARSADDIAAAIRAAGHDVEKVETRLGPAEGWLGPALDERDVVVVVGGDGAVRMVAPVAAEEGVALYHAPLGTENLFAREFGTRREPEHVVAALAAGRERAVDVAEMTRPDAPAERFMLMASMGFDADVVNDLAAHRSGSISHASYALPIARRLWHWRPSRVTIIVDGTTLVDQRKGTVIVGNSRQYACRLDPVTSAVMDDGRLDVVFLPTATRRGLITWTLRTRRRRHLAHPACASATGTTIDVHLDPPRSPQLDGDPAACRTPAASCRFTLTETQLRVVLPAG